MTISVSTSTDLRSSIQTVSSVDPTIQLSGTGPYATVTTLGKQSCVTPAATAYSGYTIQGSSATLSSSATLADTRIYQENVDGPYMPGTVQNLTINYTNGGVSNGGALLSATSTSARSLTINNVALTGTHTGWNGNGGLYMSLRSFNPSNPLNTALTLRDVKVSLNGQGNGFNGTNGGSAFLHSWNNNGVVTITGTTLGDSVFDEAGFGSSFMLINFNAPSSPTSSPVNIISNTIFKRTSNATVRPTGNVLSNVNATLTGNTFQDGAYVDLYNNISGVTFNANTFSTIAGGAAIRATQSLTGSPTFLGTNKFSGAGVALKYVSSTASTVVAPNYLNYSGTFEFNSTKTVTRLIAFGQGNDVANLNSVLSGNAAVIYADDGDDSVTAGAGADCLFGGNGADTLTGNAGADELYGEAGNDVLVGSTGSDTLTGGTGSDIYRWNSNGGLDVITDFEVSQSDQIGLANLPFNGVTPPANLSSATTPPSYEEVSSLSASTTFAGRVVELTTATTLTAVTDLVATNTNGYLLFFNSLDSKGYLVYDNDWSTPGAANGRQTAFCLGNITSLSALTALSASNFRAF